MKNKYERMAYELEHNLDTRNSLCSNMSKICNQYNLGDKAVFTDLAKEEAGKLLLLSLDSLFFIKSPGEHPADAFMKSYKARDFYDLSLESCRNRHKVTQSLILTLYKKSDEYVRTISTIKTVGLVGLLMITAIFVI